MFFCLSVTTKKLSYSNHEIVGPKILWHRWKIRGVLCPICTFLVRYRMWRFFLANIENILIFCCKASANFNHWFDNIYSGKAKSGISFVCVHKSKVKDEDSLKLTNILFILCMFFCSVYACGFKHSKFC